MKSLRIIIAVLLVSAAIFAAVNIFGINSVSVSAKPIKLEDYAPFVTVSGNVEINSKNAVVTAFVGEANISDIKEGQKAVITGNGFKNKTYNATVTHIGSNAKKVSLGSGKVVAVEVVLTIDEPDSYLKSGFTAKAKIFTSEKTQIAVVPYGAVMQDDNGEYVFVIVGDRAEKRYVKTGKELEGGFEILSGIKLNEKVVTNPAQIKKNGSFVTVSAGK